METESHDGKRIPSIFFSRILSTQNYRPIERVMSTITDRMIKSVCGPKIDAETVMTHINFPSFHLILFIQQLAGDDEPFLNYCRLVTTLRTPPGALKCIIYSH
jgi:hypothetical protein